MELSKELKSLAGLSTQFDELVATYFKERKVGQGDFLFKRGSFSNKLFYVEKGLFRLYYYSDSGKEVTAWFTSEKNFVSSIDSLYHEKPSAEFCQALEDSVIYEIEFSDFEKLLENTEGAKMAFYALFELNRSLSRYLHFLKFHSAEDRYLALLEQFPSIVQRVSLGHIASFLGISQETLSRIRSRI